jgi:5-methylcytosine-specific restriction enzyme A
MSEGTRKRRRQETGGRRQNEYSTLGTPASDSSILIPNNDLGFQVETPPEAVLREKEKARALRKSQWWQRKLARGECYYCHRKVSPADLTMDHLVPVVRGGLSTRGNVVPACKSCNNQKKYLLPVEWEEYLKSLDNPSPSEDSRG